MKKALRGWRVSKDKSRLFKTYRLKNFLAAVVFLGRVARAAERLDHHPDVRLYRYRRLHFSLTTHSAGRLTAKDYRLAGILDKMYIRYSK